MTPTHPIAKNVIGTPYLLGKQILNLQLKISLLIYQIATSLILNTLGFQA